MGEVTWPKAQWLVNQDDADFVFKVIFNLFLCTKLATQCYWLHGPSFLTSLMSPPPTAFEGVLYSELISFPFVPILPYFSGP